MMDADKPYIWRKNRLGFAMITLDVAESENNSITEQYSGQGWVGQGNILEVSESGFESWKMAARLGLEYAFTLTGKHYSVQISKVEGLIITDTNPTVIGYVTMRAFLNRVAYTMTDEEINTLEKFVAESWKKPYDKEFLPDFFSLTFKEYPL